MAELNQDGWKEWSNHVLKELQRLNNGQDAIKGEMHDIKTSLTKLSVLENQMHDIKDWKENMTEVVSPTQLKDLVGKVDSLQAFKIKAITAFVFAQILIGAIITVVT